MKSLIFAVPLLLGLNLLPATAATKKHAAKPMAVSAAPKVAPGDTLVTISTVRGPIVLELYTKKTPITAGNFIKLARKGFYNGVTFHRVVPNFVIQAGDPNSKNPKDPSAQARMGSGGPGYTIKLEPSALQFKHDPGVLAMARTSDPNSAGSQWYITLAPAHFLDGQYAVFGKVLKGMDVVEKIQQWDKINKITVGK